MITQEAHEAEIEKLEAELKLRVDHGKEFREHLRQCNGEMFRLKQTIKALEDEVKFLRDGNT